MPDFFDVLYSRRSIRMFKDEPIPRETIAQLLIDATWAATGSNMQPWEFVVITDKAFIKEINDSCKRKIVAAIESDPNSPWKRYEASARNTDVNMFYNAPCLVAIVGTLKAATISMDCALAASYLMMSATSRGLGTCWVAQGAEVRDRELLDELGIPEGKRIWAPIIVGYPKSIPQMPERKEPNILTVIQ